jgi:menaquinone-dependent protoporphyrinogen oxidase
MDARVLVAYGSKYGATAGIAEKIGEVLVREGVQADVMPAGQVGDLNPYRAVILGSAVYIGRWRKEAVRFLKANVKRLAELPVWLFSSGPTGEGDPVALTKGWRSPKGLQPLIDRIRPREVAVFHGSIDKDKMKGLEKWMIDKVGAKTEDSRDWEAIASWAGSVAALLKREAR